ncbi:hypothetical protein CgunFtcFv8_009713 [Champsocephalus gunnari]|uniref:Uncharacterized protein n=1 Tax=Champsocephalus gunnari TaxID=52237 RepID=A0AAN8GYH2_CHAGU|nr:hypothetical protein CgunFtcFv8_009713 [Champsocephalus gunnari]
MALVSHLQPSLRAPRLTALRGLLRGVQLKPTETESTPQQRQFHPSRHLRTTVSFWTAGMEVLCLADLSHESHE